MSSGEGIDTLKRLNRVDLLNHCYLLYNGNRTYPVILILTNCLEKNYDRF